jgi:competence ComEA-like helix-hairpin-helix protein
VIRFTKDEKTVIIFLLVGLFVGTIALYYRRANPHVSGVFEFGERRVKGLTNINKANRAKLIELKHVGPVLAGRIVAYREKSGPFTAKEDLKNIKGIGEKTYKKIEEQITLE